MNYLDGRREMLSLDLPYLHRLLEVAKAHRAVIWAAIAAASAHDEQLTDDEEDALILLALVLLSLRREVQSFGNESMVLAQEVGGVARNAGYAYAVAQALKRTGITVRSMPIITPTSTAAIAERLGDWPDVAEDVYRTVFVAQWRSPASAQLPRKTRFIMAAQTALDHVFGSERDPARGQIVRRGITTVSQSNLDTFRETAVATWSARELQRNPLQWRWRAVLDGMACAACVRRHGTRYPLSYPFRHLHIGCRCMPELIESSAPDVTYGEEWLGKQTEHTQRRILGKEGARAYRAGEVKLSDFVRRSEDPMFGVTYRDGGIGYAKKKAERRKKRETQ